MAEYPRSIAGRKFRFQWLHWTQDPGDGRPRAYDKISLRIPNWEKVLSYHDVIPLIIEYAAVLLNWCQVAEDGKTSYERLKGKAASIPGLEFGERILLRSNAPATDRKCKFDSVWKEGIFLLDRGLSPGSTL